MEVELHMLKTDKDLVQKTQKELELKMKDIENLRLKLEKEHIEDIERYKSE
jgi:hypothetical protein